MLNQDRTAVSPLDLQDQALNLRESVNSSRARMSAHREQMARLRAEIAALRALAANTAPAPAKPVPVPAPRPAPARVAAPAPRPVLKEAASDSAPAASSFKTGVGFRALPYAAILAAAIAVSQRPAPPRDGGIPLAAVVPTAPSPAPVAPGAVEDDGADEALLLAHEFRLPGDERPLAERLGASANPPGSRPSWTAERTGERTYRVSFHPTQAEFDYDFDVDLDARRVDPTPETAELIAPRLVSSR